MSEFMKWMSNKQRRLRWMVLITIISCLLLNTIFYIANGLKTTENLDTFYQMYLRSHLTTVLMISLVHFSFLIYALVQIMPVQRHQNVFDSIAAPTIGLNLFYSFGFVFYQSSLKHWSLVCFLFALLLAFYAFRKAYVAVQYHNYNLWFQFPYSLSSGWLTVIFAANFVEYMSGFSFSQNLEEGLTAMLVIMTLTVIAYAISVNSYSLVYPAIVAWALFDFGEKFRNENPEITATAMIAVVILTAGTFLASSLRKTKISAQLNESRQVHKKTRAQHS